MDVIKKIGDGRPTYYCNDHVFCSDRCRGLLINIY